MGLQREGTPRRAVGGVLAAACAAAFALAGTRSLAAPQGTSAQAAADPGSFDELYRRGREMNGTMKTLVARFTETTTSSLLTRPLVSRGTIAVERPSRVILRYVEPESRVLLIDGNTMTLSWPGQHLRQVTDIGAARRRVQKYFLDSTEDQLRQQFTIDDRRASDRPDTYQLTLTPKRRQIREALARLDLWVDRSSFLLAAMRMTFSTGDTKLMTFDDVVLNAPVERDAFEIAR
jgi:outer membrane lipoprotein-sorting protein